MMKKLKSILASLLIVACVTPVIVVPAVALTACKTTGDATFKGVSANQEAIAKLRIQWADFVVAERTRLGTVTDRNEQGIGLLAINEKEVKVKAALEAYLEANRKAMAAIVALPPGSAVPAPTEVLATGNAYLATTRALLPR